MKNYLLALCMAICGSVTLFLFSHVIQGIALVQHDGIMLYILLAVMAGFSCLCYTLAFKALKNNKNALQKKQRSI